MNLLFGGTLAGLMRPHFFRRVVPVQIVRSMLRQNILCNFNQYIRPRVETNFIYVQFKHQELKYCNMILFKDHWVNSTITITKSMTDFSPDQHQTCTYSINIGTSLQRIYQQRRSLILKRQELHSRTMRKYIQFTSIPLTSLS